MPPSWMTAAQLIAHLQKVPGDRPVLLNTDPKDYLPGIKIPEECVDLSDLILRHALNEAYNRREG